MTVGELIDELEGLPYDAEVIRFTEGGWTVNLDSVSEMSPTTVVIHDA